MLLLIPRIGRTTAQFADIQPAEFEFDRRQEERSSCPAAVYAKMWLDTGKLIALNARPAAKSRANELVGMSDPTPRVRPASRSCIRILRPDCASLGSPIGVGAWANGLMAPQAPARRTGEGGPRSR